MSKEITTKTSNQIQTFTQEEIKEFVKTKISSKAEISDLELKFILNFANRYNLDIYRGDLHVVSYWNKEKSRHEIKTFLGIYGYLKIANRTPNFNGYKCEVVYEKDIYEKVNGEITHKAKSFGNRGQLLGAYCICYIKDKQPVQVDVSLDEYKQKTSIWDNKPEIMIKKVALATALRYAFPEELSGVYEESEMWEDTNIDTSKNMKSVYDSEVKNLKESVKPIENKTKENPVITSDQYTELWELLNTHDIDIDIYLIYLNAAMSDKYESLNQLHKNVYDKTINKIEEIKEPINAFLKHNIEIVVDENKLSMETVKLKKDDEGYKHLYSIEFKHLHLENVDKIPVCNKIYRIKETDNGEFILYSSYLADNRGHIYQFNLADQAQALEPYFNAMKEGLHIDNLQLDLGLSVEGE